MDTLEAIQKRRAIKNFDASYVIQDDKQRELLGIALQNSPTSFNLQHWRLCIIKDPAIRAKIAQEAWNQPQVTDASLLILICGQIDGWQTTMVDKIWGGASADVYKQVLVSIDAYYRGKPQIQRDEVMRSGGILLQTLMLVAENMGYESCPLGGFNFDAVGKIVKKPDNFEIVGMVAIGKAKGLPYPRSGKLPYDEIVAIDRF